MDAVRERFVADIDLQRCISDLARLLDSRSNQGPWPALAEMLLDVLLDMLRLDFAYVRLGDDENLARVESMRCATTSELAPRSQSVREALRELVDARGQPSPATLGSAGADVSIVCLHVGEMGDLVAGARRAGFPVETERVLLTVAASQLSIALQRAVLAAVNDELRKEISHHLQTEDELRAHEQDVRSLVDGIPALVFTLSPPGGTEAANQQALTYFGMPLEEIRERIGRDLIHPHDLRRSREVFTEAMATGRACELEQRLRRSDGVYRWHQTRAFPLRDERGHIAHWYALNTDIDERKRAEDQLRARELSARLLVDSMESIPAYAIIANEVGEIVFANSQVLEYYGRTLEEVKAWPTSAHILHPDDLDRANQVVASSLAAGVPCQDEYRLKRFDGVFRWFEGRYRPVRDPQGRVINWYVLLLDIDDRKRTENVLAAENRALEMIARGEPLSAVLEELCAGIEQIVDDCRCSIAFAHALSALDESGPSVAATISNTDVIIADLESDGRSGFEPWRSDAAAKGFRSCWATPIPSRADAALGAMMIQRRVPGAPTPFQNDLIRQLAQIASIAIERRQSDDAVHKSIEDLRRADAELRRAQGQLIEAQRLSQTGSFTWDVVRDEHVWSEEMCRIFEVDPNMAKLETARDRIVPEDRNVFEAAVQLGAAGGEPDFSVRIDTPQGGIKYLHAVAHRIDRATDRPIFFGAVQDVTERKLAEDALGRARAELARANRVMTLSALTASIAHEVNQPLAGIVTNASTCLRMLAAEPPNLDGARATAQRTLRDGSRASEVIQHLRSLFTHQLPKTEMLDLNEVAREVLSLSTTDLHNGHVVLSAQLGDDLPRVHGDRVQLQQVILNLIGNATDAMRAVDDRTRDLSITTARDGASNVRLSVRDVGIGIEPSSVEKLFDAFYSTKRNGMGIGLAISRSIIESHGGQLWATANDGPGATFAFSIPTGPS